MQYKDLLFASIFVLSATAVKAQHHTNFTMAGSTRVVSKDSIVIAKGDAIPDGFKKPVSKIAAVTPAPLAPEEPKGFKSVPLAGQKAYFGSMNDYVNTFVRKYLESHNRTLNVVQDRSKKHFSLIDNVLQQHNIPKELKYLAVIESALNNQAISRAGAVGPWQFMAPTARLMGLTVNGRRDDRKDWYKSTTAAAKYLTYLYGQLNDWLLVVAAYNSGPTPIKRAMARTGSNSFWDIKKYLPRETQGHVLAFIATASIFENLNKFIGVGDLPDDFSVDPAVNEANAKKAAVVKKSKFTPEELANMAIVRISEPLSMELMCLELNIDKKLLEKWNEDYELFEYDVYDGEYYSLRIPKDKLDKFVASKEHMTKRSREIFSQLQM